LLKKDDGQIVERYRYDGKKLIKIKYKQLLDNQILGKIRPKNVRQELVFDLLDSGIPVMAISGIFGSGKTYLSTAFALGELQKGKYNKIVIIRNPIPVSGIPELGALPGDITDKLKASCAYMSDIISDLLLDTFLQQNKIEILYLGNMRSRSLNDCFILCNEAQNLSSEHVRMIISRIGEGSRIVFDFDVSQIDRKSLEKDNGMLALTEAFSGHFLFGMVELTDIERSVVARMASLIK